MQLKQKEYGVEHKIRTGIQRQIIENNNGNRTPSGMDKGWGFG